MLTIWQGTRRYRIFGALLFGSLIAAAGLSPSIGAQQVTSSQRPFTSTAAADASELYYWFVSNPANAWLKSAAVIQGKDTRRVMMDSTMQIQARALTASRPAQTVTGIQRLSFGQLLVTAGDLSGAQRAFTDRLNEAGLSDADRADALIIGIRSLSHNPFDTARMRIARGYLARLDALPATMLPQQFSGHASIADAYYVAGQAQEVAAHLGHALSLVSRLSFEARMDLSGDILSLLLRWADVTSGMPHGKAQIDSMVAWLRPLTKGDPARMSQERRYQRGSLMFSMLLERQAKIIGYLGTTMPPITAQFWLNTTRPTTPSDAVAGAQLKKLDDGIIRILEIGHWGCPGCLAALPMMERFRQTLPKNVEPWMVADEGTMWGSKRTTPEEQVQYLSEYYSKRDYRFPFAIYIGPRDVVDPDIGTVARKNPTGLPLEGWPWFIITDGRGIIRHIGFADEEEVLRTTVSYLVAEAARTNGN